MDPLFQFYYNAALVAQSYGIGIHTFKSARIHPFAVTGHPDVLGAVAGVSIYALRASFHSKWYKGLKIRPEVLAQIIDHADRGVYDSIGMPDLDSIKTHMEYGRATLEAVAADNLALNPAAEPGSRLLKTNYPEGSPVHPSWPAGHAGIAGACVTVMKAMLVCHDSDGARLPWINGASGKRPALIHSLDGDGTVDYTDPDATECTIVGELNKLASNVSLGRDMAGVHYRCDGKCGILQGEAVAISYLVDKLNEYHEMDIGAMDGWVLEKFDGTKVRITRDGAVAVTA